MRSAPCRNCASEYCFVSDIRLPNTSQAALAVAALAGLFQQLPAAWFVLGRGLGKLPAPAPRPARTGRRHPRLPLSRPGPAPGSCRCFVRWPGFAKPRTRGGIFDQRLLQRHQRRSRALLRQEPTSRNSSIRCRSCPLPDLLLDQRGFVGDHRFGLHLPLAAFPHEFGAELELGTGRRAELADRALAARAGSRGPDWARPRPRRRLTPHQPSAGRSAPRRRHRVPSVAPACGWRAGHTPAPGRAIGSRATVPPMRTSAASRRKTWWARLSAETIGNSLGLVLAAGQRIAVPRLLTAFISVPSSAARAGSAASAVSKIHFRMQFSRGVLLVSKAASALRDACRTFSHVAQPLRDRVRCGLASRAEKFHAGGSL